MLVKTKAIVLSSLKFQEKSLIVKCFTESDGLKSYFVQSAYSNKKSNQKIDQILNGLFNDFSSMLAPFLAPFGLENRQKGSDG